VHHAMWVMSTETCCRRLKWVAGDHVDDIEERGSGRTKAHVMHYRVSTVFVRESTDPSADLSEPERFAVCGYYPQVRI